VGVELNDDKGQMLWIPGGFAHGFCVLGDEPADVIYKVDVPYNPSNEGGIRWNDIDLAIPWPVPNPIVSSRDQALESFAAYTARLESKDARKRARLVSSSER
jgi:dTDP-4-dehydrorhamnose 3,5-epimerase